MTMQFKRDDFKRKMLSAFPERKEIKIDSKFDTMNEKNKKLLEFIKDEKGIKSQIATMYIIMSYYSITFKFQENDLDLLCNVWIKHIQVFERIKLETSMVKLYSSEDESVL